MGKGVVEKKVMKKKGRPSLLDLQKRFLKEQQQQQEQQHHHHHQQLQKSKSPSQSRTKTHRFQNPNPNSGTTPLRRSTRRNPNPGADDDGDEEEEGDEEGGKEEEEDQDQLTGKHIEKKLNLVLESSGSDGGPSHRKRKVDAIKNGSGLIKDEKHGCVTNAHQGAQFDDGPSTPLPDKKLLLFILDRLQKKDTYGVFAEPVDPEELPDYREVIEHPMDFSTIRKKLDGGSYANLEQFEKDVFLICSNAVVYNAPDTVYFRQARSIKELAQKNFENLRQDSEDDEPEPKIVKRGRPPTKNLKKPVSRPPLERASELSGATLATGGDNSLHPNCDARKGSLPQTFTSADSSVHGLRQPAPYIKLSAEIYERNEDKGGYLWKGILQKHGKKQIVLEDSMRNTYTEPRAPSSWQESSVLTTFNGARKFLIPVGLQAEYGYARSLARFTANLGPVAWKVASKKIAQCLPDGVKFGLGWIGENETAAKWPILPSSSAVSSGASPPGTSSAPGISLFSPTQGATESSGKMSPRRTSDTGSYEKHLPSCQPPSDSQPSKTPASVAGPSPAESASSSPIVPDACPGPGLGCADAVGGVSHRNVGAIRPRPQRQIHQHSLLLRPHANGVKDTFRFNIPPQMGVNQPTGPSVEAGKGPGSSTEVEGNRIGASAAAKNGNSLANNKLSENPGATTCTDCSPNTSQALPNAGSEPQVLNVGFRSSGSSSSGRVQTMRPPDLALQL